jgi:hypothetical protein
MSAFMSLTRILRIGADVVPKGTPIPDVDVCAYSAGAPYVKTCRPTSSTSTSSSSACD